LHARLPHRDRMPAWGLSPLPYHCILTTC
jgi:hypothetical protein